ncbi:DUF4834 family protein [Hymenobacter sp. NST-14]|uniref:DUF4834 family protein n=1 Tax=Hymenobacter piscis TaxID=2839984 RepID=UPI001C02A61C|nr:DUF4834 family protein [Hymenobacter piscis]MBT9394097.1 DUF4834 family protein [Hymenobacter piscis]
MAKFLLILLIFWLFTRYVLPVLLRFVVGTLLKKQAKKFGQQFGQQFGQDPFAQPPRPRSTPAAPGEVQVDFVPPQPKSKPKPEEFKGGEYVDFEEVK